MVDLVLEDDGNVVVDDFDWVVGVDEEFDVFMEEDSSIDDDGGGDDDDDSNVLESDVVELEDGSQVDSEFKGIK